MIRNTTAQLVYNPNVPYTNHTPLSVHVIGYV